MQSQHRREAVDVGGESEGAADSFGGDPGNPDELFGADWHRQFGVITGPFSHGEDEGQVQQVHLQRHIAN